MPKSPDVTDDVPDDAGEPEASRLRRWRLALGEPGEAGGLPSLQKSDERGQGMDRTLQQLYDAEAGGRGSRSAGLGNSAPNVNRWLGDIRSYFPKSVVQVMQQDAVDRLGLHQLLLEEEVLSEVTPDVHLAGTLMQLSDVIPEETKETARRVVRRVADDLEKRLRQKLVEAVTGAIDRSRRTSRPRPGEIDFDRTIRRNLKNYLPDRGTVIAEHLVGYARRRRSSSLKDIVLCIDQSGSMAESIVYSSVFGAVLASLQSVSTRLVLFDTAVVDMTEELDDPVDVLFGVQLGGGTDINKAVTYCREHISRPSDTVFVLISDLYEGGVRAGLLRQTAEMVAAGVQVVVLLALSDSGAPIFDEQLAAEMTRVGAPSFACTPDQFPGMMAAALQRSDMKTWAAKNEVVVFGGGRNRS